MNDEIKPRIDHKISVERDGDYTVITGRILCYNSVLSFGWFDEINDPSAFDNADLAHVVAELIYDGRRAIVAHAYTDDLTIYSQPDGLYFKIRSICNFDNFINSYQADPSFEVGYSFTVVPLGSKWATDESTGRDVRRVMEVERLYEITIRRPTDRTPISEPGQLVL